MTPRISKPVGLSQVILGGASSFLSYTAVAAYFECRTSRCKSEESAGPQNGYHSPLSVLNPSPALTFAVPQLVPGGAHGR